MKNDLKEFLFLEFEQSYIEWRRLIEEGNKRIQFLFTLMTIFLGAFGIIFKEETQNENVNVFILLGLTLLLVINHFTFKYLINRRILMDLNTRAIARIRRYFVDKNEEILPYITWQTDDSPSAFLKLRNGLLMKISISLYSIVISSSALMILNIIKSQNLLLNAILFLVTSILCFIVLYFNAKSIIELQKRKVQNQSRFSKIEGFINEFQEKDK